MAWMGLVMCFIGMANTKFARVDVKQTALTLGISLVGLFANYFLWGTLEDGAGGLDGVLGVVDRGLAGRGVTLGMDETMASVRAFVSRCVGALDVWGIHVRVLDWVGYEARAWASADGASGGASGGASAASGSGGAGEPG